MHAPGPRWGRARAAGSGRYGPAPETRPQGGAGWGGDEEVRDSPPSPPLPVGSRGGLRASSSNPSVGHPGSLAAPARAAHAHPVSQTPTLCNPTATPITFRSCSSFPPVCVYLGSGGPLTNLHPGLPCLPLAEFLVLPTLNFISLPFVLTPLRVVVPLSSCTSASLAHPPNSLVARTHPHGVEGDKNYWPQPLSFCPGVPHKSSRLLANPCLPSTPRSSPSRAR